MARHTNGKLGPSPLPKRLMFPVEIAKAEAAATAAAQAKAVPPTYLPAFLLFATYVPLAACHVQAKALADAVAAAAAAAEAKKKRVAAAAAAEARAQVTPQ